MMYLHKNNEQFLNAIELAYEQTGIMTQAIVSSADELGMNIENLNETRSTRLC